MTQILHGSVLAKQIRAKVKEDVAQLVSRKIIPTLACILCNENPASQLYVRKKIEACKEVGIRSLLFQVDLRHYEPNRESVTIDFSTINNGNIQSKKKRKLSESEETA